MVDMRSLSETLNPDLMLTQFAFHASHEQFSPSKLLQYAQQAESAGFDAITSSDHFHPWNKKQGHSGFSFAWLGAAMQASKLPFSVVCAPGQRYHPAIVAQAIATLAEMFPQRLDIALGSGEALNELITGEEWPEKKIRNQRLLECASVIRQLFDGKTVDHTGLVRVKNAKLYTLPLHFPRLFCAAVSKETAEWAGQWADGLITVQQPHDVMKDIIEAFRNNGGRKKPIHLKVQLSYAQDEEIALYGAYEQWNTNILPSTLLADLPSIDHFEEAATYIKPSNMPEMVRISTSYEQHAEWLKKDITLGIERIVLHNVNLEQELFIHDFGKHVLPILRAGNIQRS